MGILPDRRADSYPAAVVLSPGQFFALAMTILVFGALAVFVGLWLFTLTVGALAHEVTIG